MSKTIKNSQSAILSDYILSEKEQSSFSTWKQRHLLDSKSLSLDEIENILKLTRAFKAYWSKHKQPLSVCQTHTIANAFFENSTRTRTSFELAAKRLGATVVNLDIATSSTTKGETLTDTVKTLAAMDVDLVVQRHPTSGSVQMVANELGDWLQVVNAGDGSNEHPTQALLDLYTMRQLYDDLHDKTVVIVGDIIHSRVAHSNISLLKRLGARIRLVGPAELISTEFIEPAVSITSDFDAALAGSDFVMMLRLQFERQKAGLISDLSEYSKLYQLDHARIRKANPAVKVLAPGPINRGVEITGELADDNNYSLISEQVTNGVFVRMAVLYLLLSYGN